MVICRIVIILKQIIINYLLKELEKSYIIDITTDALIFSK